MATAVPCFRGCEPPRGNGDGIYLIQEGIMKMKQIKKLTVLTLALIMVGTMAACGMGDVGGTPAPSGSSTSSQASSEASPQVDESNYEDSVDGLAKYLAAKSLISGTPSTMRADFIGAEKGVRYQFGLNGKDNVTVELYQFPSTLNETAQKVLDAVKSKGSFTIMDQQVSAVLSDSGKYMLIYKDTTTNNDQNKKRQEDVTNAVKAFKNA